MEVIKSLYNLGANIEASGRYGGTPLHSASYGNQGLAIETLKFLGGNIEAQNVRGRTPLHCAADWHLVDAIEALVSLGASLHARDNDGMTPLECAKRWETVGKQEVVAILERCDAAGSGIASHKRTSSEVDIISVGICGSGIDEAESQVAPAKKEAKRGVGLQGRGW